jgi:hypothetical protein
MCPRAAVAAVAISFLASHHAMAAPALADPALADPTSADLTSADPASADSETQAELHDLTRPISKLELRYRFESKSGYDENKLYARINWKFDLPDHWILALLLSVPGVLSSKVTSTNPNGSYQFGIGRIATQAYFANVIDDRWAYAIGARITEPAASGTQFGSGNWDGGPLFGVRAMLPEISEGSFTMPLLMYSKSFGSAYPSSPTDTLRFGPQLKVYLGDSWFFMLYPTPDIRWNLGPPVSGQTGRLFLPIDAAIGRSYGGFVEFVEVSAPVVDDYPVYKLKIEARLSYRF